MNDLETIRTNAGTRLLGPFEESRSTPSRRFILGTDHLGRDQLTILRTGAHVSTVFWLEIVALTILPAATLGLAAGLQPGRAATLARALIAGLRLIQLAPPFLILLAPLIGLGLVGLLLRAGVQGPVRNVVSTLALAIALTFWHRIARAVHETSTSLIHDQRAEAIRATGGSERWVVTRHVLPALAAPLTALSLFLLTTVVPIEAAISFLWGFGATLVGTTSNSRGFWASHPHLWIPTLLLVALATWSTDRLARTCLGRLRARGHPGATPVEIAVSYLAFDLADRDDLRGRILASLLPDESDRRS